MEEVSGPIPDGIKRLLREFEDVMPDELVNQVLHGFLDEFVVVYLDDIVVYNRTLVEHEDHLRQVLTRLREHELYVKDYSEIVRPLTNLLKKTETWNWTPQCQVDFDDLNRAMVTDPMLALSDMSKSFVVETDVSNFALGGVLMQDDHPVASESRKLKDAEMRYSVHEKELLEGTLAGVTVRVSFVLEYRAGSNNHAADALSRRADLVNLESIAALSSSAAAIYVKDQVRELLLRDPAAQGLIRLVEQDKARQFRVEDGLLKTKENRIYVPRGGELRKSLLSECHDTLWAGHQGQERTYALVQRAYYWPQMLDDVETYVCTCLICQQDKADHQKKAGLLQPLPIPKHPWEFLDCLSTQTCYGGRDNSYLLQAHRQVLGTAKGYCQCRDSRFTGVFWTELFKLLGSTLSMSSSYHPQFDGQTECFNSMLEDYLRHFVRAQKRMKKYAARNRRFIEFNAGDLVKVPDSRFKSSRGRYPRLMQKYVGPLLVVRRIGTVVYKVELSSWWKIHNVFHVSQLKKYSADKEDDTRNQPSCPQLELTKMNEKVAEAILNHRVTSTTKRNHTKYLVKWRGCSSEANTWERVTNLKTFLPLVEAYHASIAPGTSLSQVGEDVKGRPHNWHP
ncbi:UNVERIFIED_CONTAM: Transposon Tf2-11 polyprotein [Sesamum indicum]